MVFSKRFIRNDDKSKEQKYKYGHLLPVKTAAELYSSTKYANFIRQLQDSSGLDSDYFEATYRPVLQRFAEFVQMLPSDPTGALGGLLYEGFARAFTAVNLLLQQDPKTEPIVVYAAFTATLFVDVSKVITQEKIILCDEKGNYVDEWQPWVSSMVGITDYYKIYARGAMYQRLNEPLVPMLARQLMPPCGFNWIASDLNLLADWIDALRGDFLQGGRVSLLLSLIKLDDWADLLASLPRDEIDLIEALINQYGEQFLIWLRDAIAKGEIAINAADSDLHMTEDGLFIGNSVFEHFTRQQLSRLLSSPVNFKTVMAQFGNLFGVASKGGGDFLSQQYFSEGAGASTSSKRSVFAGDAAKRRSISGMTLRDPSAVIADANIPAVTAILKKMQTKTGHVASLPNIQRQTSANRSEPSGSTKK